jgi:hypothetical protein
MTTSMMATSTEPWGQSMASSTTALPSQLWRWWRLRSRRGYLVIGALPSPAAHDFVERLKHGAVLPLPFDAERPDDADVVVVVGRISPKLRPYLEDLRGRLPPGALIVAIDDDGPVRFPSVPVTDVLTVDAQLIGLPPAPAMLQELVARFVPRRQGTAE